MRKLSKALLTGGLVIVTGPLSLAVTAQDYVDVEAERAAAAQRAVGQVPPQPATSYGINSAPAGPAVITRPATPTTAVAGQDQNLGTLFLQIQQLQQDVMRLNGIVEEQAHELRKLKEQSLERYVDLDKRLSGVAIATGPGQVQDDKPVVSAGTGSVSPGVGQSGVEQPGVEQPGVEQPGEGEAYRSAYALVRSQQFDQAVEAFNQFLRDFPDGKYAPNAHYWLGELYLVVEPQDLESSRQSFTLLINQYPDNSKVPDALYKLGKVHFLKGNRERAREYLDGLVRGYGDTAAAGLARDFIAENY